MKHWSDTDSRYGSRQMAARLAISGEISKIRAFLLADIVGGRKARFLRESSSTPALVDLVWDTAAKLGYSAIFLNESSSAEDDHDSFLKRGVPAVALTAHQCGIRTDQTFNRARIRSVEARRVRRELAGGRVVIVAGFQGVTEDGDLITFRFTCDRASQAALAPGSTEGRRTWKTL